MRIIFSFLTLAFLFTSCNDGDIITTALEFEETFNTVDCGDLICYKIKTDPAESLSVVINTTLVELIATEFDATNPLLVNLINNNPAFTNNDNQFNYRTYNNEINSDVFCSVIPPSNLSVTNDYNSNVNAIFAIVLTEDDNDGIPAELEDIDGDGDLENDDTDGDGLPNYIDADDDGDNVLTASEMPNYTVELLLTEALDTDGDGIPNYLDTDDDNDLILTINEEGTTQDQNPANDIENNTVGADYLNVDVVNNIPATAFRLHPISQSFQLSLNLTNIVLPILIQDTLDFGTLTTTTSRSVTPAF
ncbi:hypothetical protein [Lacinutrix jangbogonensis]|uniref:hypothetical protein n=1 Tax=Lacinutrix jangbogonensis TaxID=1469557 RepID=UPI00053E1CA6|nr:hypothetical protein [Lacinutrix jangbogonensis]